MEDSEFKKMLIKLGNKIKKCRMEKNMTAKELLARTGLNYRYLKNIENGNYERISISKIFILADGLGIPANNLVEDL